MGYGRFTDYQVSAWLDEIAALDLHAALFIGNPFTAVDITSVYALEVPGSDYARQAYTVERVSPNYLRNANLLAFLGLPPGTSLVAAGAFDDPVAGQLRFAVLFDTPVNLPSGGTYPIAAGALGAGLDVATGP